MVGSPQLTHADLLEREDPPSPVTNDGVQARHPRQPPKGSWTSGLVALLKKILDLLLPSSQMDATSLQSTPRARALRRAQELKDKSHPKAEQRVVQFENDNYAKAEGSVAIRPLEPGELRLRLLEAVSEVQELTNSKNKFSR